MTWPSRRIGRAIAVRIPARLASGARQQSCSSPRSATWNRSRSRQARPLSPSPSRNLRRAGQPLKLVVDPPRFQREDQGVFRRIDRPVRSIGPAELLADRVQRAADDVVDRLGPDDGIDRVDHGLCVGVGLSQQRLRLLGAVEHGRGCGPSCPGRCHRAAFDLADARRGRSLACRGLASESRWGGSTTGRAGRLLPAEAGIVERDWGLRVPWAWLIVGKGGMSGTLIDPIRQLESKS